MAQRTDMSSGAVLVRPASADDDAALLRLAELEGARPLEGPALVAEENGGIVAAVCLSTRHAVADPFAPSAHLVELLRYDAARRLAPSASRRRRLLPRLALRAGFRLIGAARSW